MYLWFGSFKGSTFFKNGSFLPQLSNANIILRYAHTEVSFLWNKVLLNGSTLIKVTASLLLKTAQTCSFTSLLSTVKVSRRLKKANMYPLT